MDNEDNPEKESTEPEVYELRLKVESLKQELKDCKAELSKLQKQLSQSERLQQRTESYNEDLRKQVDQLSAEIHRRKKKEKDKVHIETQTEEYVWTEKDYYNYYYGSYSLNSEEAVTQDNPATESTEAAVIVEEESTVAEVSAAEEKTATANESIPPVSDVVTTTEAVDEGSIADMLRATAEEAMTQSGFVFDETSGMYYDHSTGFYYDSASQLHYDSNTGIYYYYDAESGRYQFHSRVDMPAAQTDAELQEDKLPEKKSRKYKKWFRKTSNQEDQEITNDNTRPENEDADWLERRNIRKRESRKLDRRSCSPDSGPHRKDSRHREEREGSSSKRRKLKNGSHHKEKKKSGRKSRKSKSEKHKKKKKKESRSDDSEYNSEPEEGEISESEKEEWKSIPSSSPATSSHSKESPEPEMEIPIQEVKNIWPPCVRVTVVRSPVLQVGTLFIITADSTATFGREKDMDHAVRIPEMGVSKLHAEVYFDQEHQSYMLVDYGSQNGTVLNGNRILQPKTKSEPHALTHGDEVKMGDTVLSFHIHSGTDTCDGCEPGQVMAHLSKHKREETSVPTGVNKEDKESLRQKELKQIKAKYGLHSNEYEETKTLKNAKYKDRAHSRRQAVGSEGVFQRDDAPASVHEEISEVNPGRKMLEKMGWKKGEGLGKDGTGMKIPIELKIRKSQAGLGAGVAMSLDNVSITQSRSNKNWEKARERFADTCQAGEAAFKTEMSKAPKAWVRAEEMATSETGSQS